jgi:hypothetical protein
LVSFATNLIPSLSLSRLVLRCLSFATASPSKALLLTFPSPTVPLSKRPLSMLPPPLKRPTFMELAPKDSPYVSISSYTASDPFESMPHIFKRSAKITIDYKGQFHKGYLHHDAEGGFQFIFKCSPQSKKSAWSVSLPNFTRHHHSRPQHRQLLPPARLLQQCPFLHPKSQSRTCFIPVHHHSPMPCNPQILIAMSGLHSSA